jgi:hypothetical protein
MLTGIIVLILFLLRKPINKAMTRGYRNNNFGNIRKTYDTKGNQTFWKGEIKGTDPSFKTFATPADGYRALFALLLEYNRKGFNTIRKVISRYAPSNENDTMSYINNVSLKTGKEPDSLIVTSDSEFLKKLVAAISLQENGVQPDPNDISEGFKKL